MISPEVEEFLAHPENLEMALELEPVISELRKVIFRKFWEAVYEELQKRLAEGNYRWEMNKFPDVGEPRSSFGLNDKIDTGLKRLSFQYERLTGDGDDCYYGIARGIDVETPAGIERTLIKNLEAESMGTDLWWVGYKRLKKTGIDLHMADNRSVLRLNNDNLDNSRPLARHVAQQLWDLFVKHHSDVEKINDNWPYGA